MENPPAVFARRKDKTTRIHVGSEGESQKNHTLYPTTASALTAATETGISGKRPRANQYKIHSGLKPYQPEKGVFFDF